MVINNAVLKMDILKSKIRKSIFQVIENETHHTIDQNVISKILKDISEEFELFEDSHVYGNITSDEEDLF